MSFPRCSPFRILLAIITTIALYTFYSSSSGPLKYPITNSKMESRTPSDLIANLPLTLTQTSKSPATVRATITNNHKTPITVLTYDSPLDELALKLGLLSITPAGASEKLQLQVVQVRRMWPPAASALTEIAPGASVTKDFVLQEPFVPVGKIGGKATVELKGLWNAVWARGKDGISKEQLDNSYESADESSQPFCSNKLEIAFG